MLSLIDAEYRPKDAGVDKFLLTDFCQTHIDRWNTPKVLEICYMDFCPVAVRPMQIADLNFGLVFLTNRGVGSVSVFWNQIMGWLSFVVNTTVRFVCGFVQHKKW
jgi:hypothetical protein